MKRKLAALSLLLLLTVGCIHKTSAAITPWERVTTDNAILAQSINTIEQGAEAAVTSGVLSRQAGGQLIGYTGQAATIQLQVNALLATAPNVSASDLNTVSSLVTQLGNSASSLISSGQIGVKNPTSQQLFSADVQAVVNVSTLLISEIQAAKGSK